MDFIEALPKVFGKSIILTIVDQLSKHAHFIALSHPCTSVGCPDVLRWCCVSAWVPDLHRP